MAVEDNDNPQTQGQKPEADKVSALSERRDVLDYVSDIARELAALLDRHGIRPLGDDLRAIALNALKAKYQDSADTQTPSETPPETET
jgi:hypothetical protein